MTPTTQYLVVTITAVLMLTTALAYHGAHLIVAVVRLFPAPTAPTKEIPMPLLADEPAPRPFLLDGVTKPRNLWASHTHAMRMEDLDTDGSFLVPIPAPVEDCPRCEADA